MIIVLGCNQVLEKLCAGWLLKVCNQNPQLKWRQNLKLCPYETRNVQTGKHGAGVACCFKNL